MELLVLSACGLVANQYMTLRSKGAVTSPVYDGEREQYQQEQQPAQQQQQQQPENLGVSATTAQTPSPVFAPHYHASSSSTPAPIPLGVRTLKTDDTGDVGYDEARYNEQYSHPQDPNPNVSEKPWMRMANAPYKPKEEILSSIPGPQDLYGRDLTSRVKKMESDFASSTVPVTSEKQFDRPVEQISTGNGSAVGFHIGAGRRYHKFVLNDQPTIESEGGPRGAFSGASGQHVKGDYRTVTQRSSLNHESVGPPMAVGVPQSSAPAPSFEIKPAHLETYMLDKHLAKSARAPVQAAAAADDFLAFRGAHDERVDVVQTSLARGGERFATGASGNRDAKVHVPLNNDPLATYDQRVVPNFKIAKASDFQDQHVTARQMMIPEMSQNVSALRKDKRPPVLGSTLHKKASLVIDTGGVQSGAAVRGSTSLPVKVQTDSFRAPADRKVVVAERAAQASTGASAAHVVGTSGSSFTSPSLFRTTQSMSELVGTPFIRGAGSKKASGLEPIHEATDTHLSELESSGIRQGLNKVATSVAATTGASNPSPSTSISKKTQERGDVFKKSERAPILVTPGMLGTNRVGAANFDAGGLISQRGLGLDDEANVNVMRAGTTNNVLAPPTSQKKLFKKGSKTTKERKLGDVLNARLGSSTAMKQLLQNPYSLPAASRLSF